MCLLDENELMVKKSKKYFRSNFFKWGLIKWNFSQILNWPKMSFLLLFWDQKLSLGFQVADIKPAP